jgi:hypothetical protein
MNRYLEIRQHMPRRQNVRRRSARSASAWGRPQWFVAGLIVLIVLFAAILSVWSSGRVVNLGYLIRSNMIEKQKLIDERNALNLEISRLKSPEWLEIEANRFGFVKPESDQYVRIEGQMRTAPTP